LSTYGDNTFTSTIGGTLPPGNCTWKTYYGSFAVRTLESGNPNNGVHFTIQDNLGSTSETVEPDNSVLHNRFLTWGVDDAAHTTGGSRPTDNQYTGQDKSSNSGLYFYASRWYDPCIMRWIQPDTVIPDVYNPLDLDRYAYVENDPVNHNDPTGHCTDPVECLFAALGWGPDSYGIVIATSNINSDTGSIETAAGIAVQSEFLGPLDYIIIPGASSGYGIAQTNVKEIKSLDLGDLNPLNNADSVKVMQARINSAHKACLQCTDTDFFVVAALAQNNSIAIEDIKYWSGQAKGNGIAWKEYFHQNEKSNLQPDAAIRQSITRIPYNTRFMLLKFILDIRALHQNGWDLPRGISEAELDSLEKLARTGQSGNKEN